MSKNNERFLLKIIIPPRKEKHTILNVEKQTTQDIGKNLWSSLEKVLNEREMSIYRLAEITGIPRTQIYALKNGRQETFGWKYMVKIADVLDVSLDIFR